MKVQIYHNPRCSKSRQTLDLIQSRGILPEITFYLDNPPTSQELQIVLGKLNLLASELIRSQEDLYKELKLSSASEEQLIQAMVANPKLIERPIVIVGKKAVLGRPPENINKIL